MSDVECPSAERIASNEMSAEERGAWLDHAAGCASCRAIALVMSHDEQPASVPADAVDATKERIGRFVIAREIGRGAMGVVYEANDPELGRTVAIKVLHDVNAAERLRREARALARLDHPNVVRVYDVGVADGRAFVAMELIAGMNMRRWLVAEPRKLPEVIDVLVQAGRGLAGAHAAGIVHRDFKPDNVFVAPGRVVVGDFGLSSLGGTFATSSSAETSGLDISSDDKLTMSGTIVGTPAYMAPEQAAGGATAASDQFAFCVAAWEACFGARPFSGTTLREIREQAAAGLVLRPVGAALPRRLERALRRGLSARDADRFPSMDALVATIAPRRRQKAIIAVAVLAIALIGAVVWSATRKTIDPCKQAGEAIAEAWTPSARARVRAANGDVGVAELDRYATAWRDARVALCRMPATTDLVETERRAAREACYERARIEFARNVVNPTLALARGREIPLAACESGLVLSETPGIAVDPRGCGCPYSPCIVDEQRCLGQCTARAFRMVGPIAGVASPVSQEAVVGATSDGARLLVLGGEGCQLDHLYLASRIGNGEAYESIDLTPQLAGQHVMIYEGCCTLARDGRSIVMRRTDVPGFVRFPLDGTRLGPRDTETFAQVLPGPPLDQPMHMPVLTTDQRTFYFVQLGTSERAGIYEAKRDDPNAPFAPGRKVTGRAIQYEYATGVSDDELTMFLASEFATRVLVRATRDQPYGDLGTTIMPSRLPGWRTIPIDGCRRLIATVTPGGCESEQAVIFEAIGP